ncbi:MAG: hypothetical protein ACXWV6_03340 [Chitinophagaceae bacterium]
MRRCLYIIAALLFLNASTELHQFSRLPFLLSHYHDHKLENPSVSWLEFLKLHYTGKHPFDNDDNKDNQLPFKSIIILMHTDIPIVFNEQKSEPPFRKYIDKPGTFLTEHIPNSPPISIFHPPRFA